MHTFRIPSIFLSRCLQASSYSGLRIITGHSNKRHASKLLIHRTSRSCRSFTISFHNRQQQQSHQQQQKRPRLRFRAIPAFTALFLAQLFVLWDVSHNTQVFETGDSGKFLSSSEFLPYTIIHKDVVSPNSCILTLRPGTYTGLIEDIKGNFLDAWRLRLDQGLGKPPVLTRKDLENLRKYQDDLWMQGIWSIEIKQPQMSILRRYTPLPPNPHTFESETHNSSVPSSHQDAGIFRLFIRREPEGEVSRYLYDQAEGATIEIRGGFLEYQIPNNLSQLTFIAGGTGIAPALAAAYSLGSRQLDLNMQILWANRRREDCTGGLNSQSEDSYSAMLSHSFRFFGKQPGHMHEDDSSNQKAAIVKQLENMKHSTSSNIKPSRLKVDTSYFVDEEGSFIQKNNVIQALQLSATPYTDRNRGKRLILVSGPDGFVDHIAGRKILREGQELQGPQGGVLAQIDLSGWEIWKL